jgi:Protein of unknown function (DUF1579)
MRSLLRVLAACGLLSAAGAAAAPAQEARPAEPGPEHKRLGYFVGRWTTEGEIKPGPMGPGGRMRATDTCEWFQGGYSVVCRAEGTGPSGPSRSLGILGYNTEEKVYTYYGVDNTAMTMASVPKGSVQGGTWTYTDQGTMGGQEWQSRVVIKELSPTEYTFRMELRGPDGKWLPMVESKSTKAK